MNLESEGVPGLEPPMHVALAWWSLLTFLVVALPVIVVVAKLVWICIRCRTQTQPVTRPDRTIRLSPSRATLLAFARESVWLLVPCIVFVSFAVMTDPRGFLSGLNSSTTVAHSQATTRSVREGEGVQRPQEQPPRESAPVATSPSLTPPVGQDHAPVLKLAPQRPTWVDQTRVIDGDCTRIVLTSQQYATKEEAEQELRVAAVKLVEQDLQRIQTGSFRPQSWRPSADDVIAHAVQHRYEETAERDFGSFSHPMTRVSWQVELSPRVRTEFAPAWRRELISFRIMWVAGVASIFAMLASASLMYFRLDTRTQGQSRGRLKLLATGAMAGWLMLVASAFSQGHLW